jgi:ribosome-associated protein
MKKTVKKAVKAAIKKTEKKSPAKKAKAKKPAVTITPPKMTAAEKAAIKVKKTGNLEARLKLITTALDQDKGTNIVSIDLAGKTAIADYMVIVTGTSSRHVSSMAEKLRDRMAKEGVRARIEGKGTGDWVIVDTGDIMVHLFRQEVRDFYSLEKLWGTDFSAVDYTLYK